MDAESEAARPFRLFLVMSILLILPITLSPSKIFRAAVN